MAKFHNCNFCEIFFSLGKAFTIFRLLLDFMNWSLLFCQFNIFYCFFSWSSLHFSFLATRSGYKRYYKWLYTLTFFNVKICFAVQVFLFRENAQENRAKRKIRGHSWKPNLSLFSVYREALTSLQTSWGSFSGIRPIFRIIWDFGFRPSDAWN